MTQTELGRALALVFVRFTPQARARLMQVLPQSLRHTVGEMMDDAEGLSLSGMSFVEQVLHADLEAMLADEEEAAEARLLVEVWPLQVSDLLTLVLLYASPQQAAQVLLRLPPALQGEVLHKAAVQHWDALERRLGRAELVFLQGVEDAWDAPPREADPEFAADLLRHIPSPRAVRRLLTEMYRLDPEPTGEVQDLLYRFEEMGEFTDQELQTILVGVDHWDLALALRSAPARLRQRVLNNISERRAGYLVEDEEMLSDVEPEEVEAVQRRIVDRARGLYETGHVHTYFGSVAIEEEENRRPPQKGASDSSDSRSGTPSQPPQRRWDLRAVGAGLAGVVLVVLLVMWMGGVRSGSRSSGRAPGRGALMGDSEVQRDGFGEFRGGPGRAGGGRVSADVALVVGNVHLNSGQAKRPAEGQMLQPGDWVETDPGGQAVLRLWADAGQVQVEASSAVQVGEEGEERTSPPQLSFRLGNAWIYVKNPALEVRSPLGEVTASEGALYQLRVVLDATTSVSVHRGTVWVNPLVGGEQGNLVLGPEDGVRIFPSGQVVFEAHEAKSEWLGVF